MMEMMEKEMMMEETTTQGQPLVTVIVPVYKVERYLDECMRSIVAQTHRNLEVILVDDGSPDDCPALCDAWAARDARVRVIHKPNGGLASARNAALEDFAGDYVTFVDSDDWIDADMVESMLRTMREQRVQLVMCSTRREYDEGFAGADEPALPARRLTSDEAVRGFLYAYGNLSGAAWGKLYAAALFRPAAPGGDPLRFPDGLNSEDYPVLARIYRTMDAMAQTPARHYHYRMRAGSICTATEVNAHTFDKITVQDMACDYLESTGWDDARALAFYRMQARYDVLHDLLEIGADRALVARQRRRLRAAARPVYADPSVGAARKAKIAMMATMPRLYHAIKNAAARRSGAAGRTERGSAGRAAANNGNGNGNGKERA